MQSFIWSWMIRPFDFFLSLTQGEDLIDRINARIYADYGYDSVTIIDKAEMKVVILHRKRESVCEITIRPFIKFVILLKISSYTSEDGGDSL